MEGIKDILDNSATREVHKRQRMKIINRFPELSNCPHKHFLSHIKYIQSSPQKYFSHKTYSALLKWLSEQDQLHPKNLKNYFIEYSNDLNRAILHLEEINNYEWHDSFDSFDEYDLIRFIDQRINPSFLRLTEAVLAPFLHIIAFFSRHDRKKGIEGLNVWNIIQEVKKYTPIGCVTETYQHVIRNAIAHGGITYLQNAITYKDINRNKEKYSDREIIRKFDDLIDTCNALSAALSVFLISNKNKEYLLPQQFLLEELRAETMTPWWKIVGCIPSMYENLNQLVIYSRPNTSDINKIRYSTFQSGVLAEFFAPGYDRYFFSLKSSNSWPGFASFDGNELKNLRKKMKTTLMDYSKVMDNFSYKVPGIRYPEIIYKIETRFGITKFFFPYVMEEFRENVNWPEIIARDAKIHRNSWGCVVRGSVFINSHYDNIDQAIIIKHRRKIIGKVLKFARKTEKFYSLLKFLPVGFALISIYQKDYRRRRLIGFGLGEDLIGTIKFQRIKRIKNPDILGSTIEIKGKYRFAWNKAWLSKERREITTENDSQINP